MNLVELGRNFGTEEAAIKHLEGRLWPDGPVCPHCGIVGEAFRMRSHAGTKNKMRPGLWKCKGCRKTFRVTLNTIFEDSHIPLHKWMMAVHLMCASKKAISAHQMHRMLGLGYRAAWFVCHRIRHATKDDADYSPMTGTVEVDEAYVGGKRRKGVPYIQKVGERPQDVPAPTDNKAPLVSLLQRDGKVRSFHMQKITAKELKPVTMEYISKDAVINTDESGVYLFAKDHFAGHETVNHKESEYARRENGRLITTNTVEGFFSLIKRSVYGTFHHVSREHLHRYLSEFDFRYNGRKTTDGERADLAWGQVTGKRLMYRTRLGVQN